MDPQRIADDRPDPLSRIQRGVRVLEDHLQLAPHRTQVPPLKDRLGTGHLDACFLEPDAKRAKRETTIHPELEAESA